MTDHPDWQTGIQQSISVATIWSLDFWMFCNSHCKIIKHRKRMTQHFSTSKWISWFSYAKVTRQLCSLTNGHQPRTLRFRICDLSKIASIVHGNCIQSTTKWWQLILKLFISILPFNRYVNSFCFNCYTYLYYYYTYLLSYYCIITW